MPSPKSAATKPAAPKPADTLGPKIDELGDIEKKLAPFRGLIAREKLLRDSIRAAYDNREPEKTFEVKGSRFLALLGARGNERSIDMGKLWKLGGPALMKLIATVTLKKLEEAAPQHVLSVVSFAPTGSRSLKVFELGSEQKAA